jgi:hypothetical protein
LEYSGTPFFMSIPHLFNIEIFISFIPHLYGDKDVYLQY